MPDSLCTKLVALKVLEHDYCENEDRPFNFDIFPFSSPCDCME